MPKKIDPELKARAVRLVRDHIGEYPSLSAATTMLDGGIHLKAVSNMLGHAGVQITGDTYSHVSRRTAVGAMTALGKVLPLRHRSDDDAASSPTPIAAGE